MTTDTEAIFNAARSLPPLEQLELMQRLAQSLATSLSPLAAGSAAFWRSVSIEEVVREQKVAPVTDVSSLAMTDWPEDETADEVIAFVREQRRADREA
jgi:hypothetical protein